MVLRAPRFKASLDDFDQSFRDILKSLSLVCLGQHRATRSLKQGQHVEVLTWRLAATKFFGGKLACNIRRRHHACGESTCKYAQKSM